MKPEKIRYNDIGWELKIPIIYSWIMTILFFVAMTIGYLKKVGLI